MNGKLSGLIVPTWMEPKLLVLLILYTAQIIRAQLMGSWNSQGFALIRAVSLLFLW